MGLFISLLCCLFSFWTRFDFLFLFLSFWFWIFLLIFFGFRLRLFLSLCWLLRRSASAFPLVFLLFGNLNRSFFLFLLLFSLFLFLRAFRFYYFFFGLRLLFYIFLGRLNGAFIFILTLLWLCFALLSWTCFITRSCASLIFLCWCLIGFDIFQLNFATSLLGWFFNIFWRLIDLLNFIFFNRLSWLTSCLCILFSHTKITFSVNSNIF